MEIRQLELFTVRLAFRTWCGHGWLVLVWRDWNGNIFAEFVLERLT